MVAIKRTGASPEEEELSKYEIMSKEEGEAATGGPADGTQFDATVTKIEIGRVGEFIKSQNAEKWDNIDSKCTNLTIEANDVSFTKIITLPPEGNKAHPKSNFAKYVNLYKQAPFVGQKVKTMVVGGYQRLLLP